MFATSIDILSNSMPQAAMYAVDSLRQLSMKFLERDELASYTFQNDFLKPFVIVMRKSTSMEIRELVIRCVSQMVFARSANIRSGWKSMVRLLSYSTGCGLTSFPVHGVYDCGI